MWIELFIIRLRAFLRSWVSFLALLVVLVDFALLADFADLV
jgi:hypothetical protein